LRCFSTAQIFSSALTFASMVDSRDILTRTSGIGPTAA
jgi:hypothetical protein